MDKRMRGAALGLIVLAALMVVGLPGLAVAGPKIETTRPLSDAGYVIAERFKARACSRSRRP